METRTPLLAIALLLGAAGASALDVYDVQDAHDNSPNSTRNELIHGSDQWHDLAALPGPRRDRDWYRISKEPFSSYEVVVEGISGDVEGPNFQVQRVAGDGTTVLQSAEIVGTVTRSLRFANHTADPVNEYIVVRGASCGLSCGADDVYRIRASETTASIPRFNNSGTQVTVTLLQNPTNYTIDGLVYFWGADGTAAGTAALNLAPKALQVLNTSTVVPGTSGSITIAHDARYGDLSGKAVALEPATGFSFDTALAHRPR